MGAEQQIKEAHDSGFMTYIYIAIGAIGMEFIKFCLRFFEKRWGKNKEIKDLKAQDLKNEGETINNFERLNNLLSKQLEVNVNRYLDILNTNISLKGENAALREQLQELKCEVRQLKQAIKDFEFEVAKLKKYIKENQII
jgi:chromosome segregation ATPase